jgi:hypothetical protein
MNDVMIDDPPEFTDEEWECIPTAGWRSRFPMYCRQLGL